jgi:PqqD family protein of HPr-rel-A system
MPTAPFVVKSPRAKPVKPSRARAFARSASIVESDVGEDLLLFETETNAIHALNASAKVIWNRMSSGPRNTAEIAAYLAEIYGLKDSAQVADDVEAIVKHLAELKLVTRGSGGTIGREYYFDKKKPSAYAKPAIRSFDREWLLANHPGSFYSVMFGDTWQPSEPH